MPENDEDIWREDLLNRKPDADFLVKFLVSQIEKRRKANDVASYVLNIDADWGAGKTFFLDRFGEQLRSDGYIVAQVNAWQDDHTDDPFVAVLSAIDDAVAPLLDEKKELWTDVKRAAVPTAKRVLEGAVRAAAKKYLDTTIDDLFENDDASNFDETLEAGTKEGALELLEAADKTAKGMLSAFKGQRVAIDRFRSRLGKAVAGIGDDAKLPLFVLIDELDRCRPSYAVALLERTKHLFDADNVVFVFATNAGQLQHSIAGAYGVNFQGYRYLQRFFDGTYQLRSPNRKRFIELELAGISREKLHIPTSTLEEFVDIGATAYELQLREIQRLASIISYVTDTWDARAPIEAVLLVPLIVGFMRTGRLGFDETVGGIPTAYRLERPERDDFGRATAHMEQFRVKQVFEQIQSLTPSLDDAIKHGERSRVGWETQYAYETFLPEWNNVVLRRGSASSQRKLPALIACAGRLSEAIDEGDTE